MKLSFILGSRSDEKLLERAEPLLKRFELQYTVDFISAHRAHNKLINRVEELEENGTEVFIAVAGLSAALPGVIASLTTKPVIGVPVSGKISLDSILSIVQMPSGVPVAAVGLDRSDNAVILAAEILALGDEGISYRLKNFKKEIEG